MNAGDDEHHRREAEREARDEAQRVIDRRADVAVGGREERVDPQDALEAMESAFGHRARGVYGDRPVDSPRVEALRDAWARKDAAAVAAALAPDATLLSPITTALRFRGPAEIQEVLEAAYAVIDDGVQARFRRRGVEAPLAAPRSAGERRNTVTPEREESRTSVFPPLWR